MILRPPAASCFIVKLDIRTTACHVGCDGNCSMLYLHVQRSQLPVHGTWHSVRCVGFPLSSACRLKSSECLDGDRTNQYRLCFSCASSTASTTALNFSFLSYTQHLQDPTLYRLICRNLNNIHSVNITELFFLCESCTCHTGFLRHIY